MSQPTLPAQLRRQDGDRLRAYKDRLDFYLGTQWPRSRDRKARQLVFNYARAVIDKVTAYTLKGMTVGIGPQRTGRPAESDASAAELALADVSAANNLPRLDYDTEIDTAVLGDGCFKVTWDQDEQRVVITAPDVQGIFAWPHPHDLTRFTRIAQRYQLPAADVARLWGFATKTDPATVTEDWTADTLTIWVGETVAALDANPYGFLPFVLFPNQSVPKRWWGVSDIDTFRDTAVELNRQLTRLSQILELSGNPIAVLENVEQGSDIKAVPGAVWEIPENAKAYLLDLLKGGGVKLHVEYADLLLRTLYDLSETPKTAFGSTGRDLSGIALEVELQPLLQRVDRKRLIRGQAYTARARLTLALIDANTGSNHSAAGDIEIAWDSPTPQDHSRQVTDEIALVNAGLRARSTAMAALGEQNPQAELTRADAERLDNNGTTA